MGSDFNISAPGLTVKTVAAPLTCPVCLLAIHAYKAEDHHDGIVAAASQDLVTVSIDDVAVTVRIDHIFQSTDNMVVAVKSDRVEPQDPEINTSAAALPTNWTVTSTGDPNYGTGGLSPLNCAYKTELSGHGEMEWPGNDYRCEYTYEHWICLQLPNALQ